MNTIKARKIIFLGLLMTLVSCESFPVDVDSPKEFNSDKDTRQNAEAFDASHEQLRRQSKLFLEEQDTLRRLLEEKWNPVEMAEPVMPEYNPLDEVMVTLNVDNGDIQYILQALARQADMNLLVHPLLTETPVKVSVHFTDTPASTVFRQILRIADLSGEVVNNLLIVNPLAEQIFNLDFLETKVNSSFSSGGDVLGASTVSGTGGGTNPLSGEFSIDGDSSPDSNPYDDLQEMLDALIYGYIQTTGSGGSGGGIGGGGSGGSSTRLEGAQSLSELSKLAELEGALRAQTALYSLNRLTGTLFVRAKPSVIDSVGRLVQRYRKVLGRQILIEAQILEVSLTDQFKHGINWSLLRNEMVQTFGASGFTMGGITAAVPGAFPGQQSITIRPTDLNTIGSATSGFAYGNQDLAVAINLLKGYGTVKVLSNPTIRSKHGQPALISVGRSISYVSGSTLQEATGGSFAQAQTIEVSTVFDGLMLGIVPFIADGDDISLVVQPIQSAVAANSLSLVSIGGTAVTLPQVDLKVMTTSLRLHDRDTVILGGLISKDGSSNTDRVPGLSKIPVLGYLFKSKEVSNSVRELVIVLRVTIL